jgi:hypothetical protein
MMSFNKKTLYFFDTLDLQKYSTISKRKGSIGSYTVLSRATRGKTTA